MLDTLGKVWEGLGNGRERPDKERENMKELTTQELWDLYFQLCDKGAALLKARDLEAEAANYDEIQQVKRELASRPEVSALRM